MATDGKKCVCCPKCGGRTKTWVLPQTVLVQFPLWCPWCKDEYIISKDAGA